LLLADFDRVSHDEGRENLRLLPNHNL
jgi:hypothetical protein